MSTPTPTPSPARTQSLVRRHPLISFYVLTYAVAWMLWAPLVIFRDQHPRPAGIRPARAGIQRAVRAWRVCSSPSCAAEPACVTLLRRLLHARIGLRWYLAVLALSMLAPLAIGVSILFGGATPVVGNDHSRRPVPSSCSRFSRAALWVKNSDGGVSSYHACRHATVP